MKKTILLILICTASGLTAGFYFGNRGPVYGTGYATGQLDLVRELRRQFPHDPKNDKLPTITGYNIKDAYIRVIEKNGTKTLDVNW